VQFFASLKVIAPLGIKVIVDLLSDHIECTD